MVCSMSYGILDFGMVAMQCCLSLFASSSIIFVGGAAFFDFLKKRDRKKDERLSLTLSDKDNN